MADKTKEDRVAPELRAAEKEIDNEFRNSPLISLPFTEAAWLFLAFCEELMVMPLIKDVSADDRVDSVDEHLRADDVINHAKWTLRWLSGACRDGGKIPRRFDGRKYEWSHEFSQLASDYLSFESACTYATLGFITLTLDGQHIVPSPELRKDTRYETYDLLEDIASREGLDHVSDGPPPTMPVQVRGQWFDYTINPKIVERTLARTRAHLDRRFALPIDWQLTGFTLGEYTQVLKVLWALSLLHLGARIQAIQQGCVGVGYSRSLVVMTPDELVRRTVRYSGIEESHVRLILEDLTFAPERFRSPDLALQPLLKLGSDIAWSPSMILNSSLERNLIVLMNRIPDARNVYGRVNQQKEDLLRLRIKESLAKLGWRFWDGDVQWRDALDVDLAIISDSERRCLVLELKSFIAPAEPREIVERSQEIARGVEQLPVFCAMKEDFQA